MLTNKRKINFFLDLAINFQIYICLKHFQHIFRVNNTYMYCIISIVKLMDEPENKV